MSDDLPSPDDLRSASTTPTNTASTRHGIFVPQWLVIVVVLALFFAGGIAIGRWAIGTRSTTTAGPGSPSTSTTPAAPTDPHASSLSSLVVHRADVGPNLNVQLLAGGNQVSRQATLDLCNGRFPSESHRTARLQDVVLDNQGNPLSSTEAVLYSNAGTSAQAFSELRAVAAKCPNTPVVSPVGEPTVTTHFNAAPDAHWPQAPAIDRLAFSFTTTDRLGQSQPSIAVYLRRGRALMGLYFPQRDAAQPPISGQTTIAGIVDVFATRLAQLPASTINSR
jgi:hypothetical protein